MGYYSIHAIFLKDNDIQKLKLIQALLEAEGITFLIRKQRVYSLDGESIKVPCISDVNWNCRFGYKWYDFRYDMEKVSEKFNAQYPDDDIYVYEKTEDCFEILHTISAGELLHSDEIIHYWRELEKVCKSLNNRRVGHRMPLYKIINVASHPTIAFQGGAYTFIGYNVYELHESNWRYYMDPLTIGSGCRNYNFLPDRIKALQLLNDYLLTVRNAGQLAQVAIPRPKRRP